MRALAAIAGSPWPILPEALALIVEIASREHLPDLDAVRAKQEQRAASLAAVPSRLIEGTRGAFLLEQYPAVARLPVVGPLFRHADAFTDISGAATTESLARDFRTALASPGVGALILDVDSPGGEAAGIGEFASMIRRAAAADGPSKKPVVAYVDGYGASAAYYLASAAGKVVASPSAILGSIGVVMVYRDSRARDERLGVKDWEIVSEDAPNKRPDPATEAGRRQIQETVNALSAVFRADVGRFRGLSADEVAERFGRGGLLVGEAARAAGMADALDTFDGVAESLSAAASAAAAPERRIYGLNGTAIGREGASMSGDTQPDPGFFEQLRGWLGGKASSGEPAASAPAADLRPQLAAALAERDAALAERDAVRAAAVDMDGQIAAFSQRLADELIRQNVRAEGRESGIVSATAARLVEQRDWTQLATLADEERKIADERLTPGVSANRRRATQPSRSSGSVGAGSGAAGQDDGEELTDERRRELLSRGPLGRAVLARERNGRD